ncbi:hypothetical protein [Micromonospora sp. CPCC 205561]|uniref:hypothetical protein n=1 Tax=Micromonospora sp. CPCC 205561 TaxID=3122407 RepID=UPI002FEEAD29
MNRLRATFVALISLSVLALTACGGEESATTAGSTPSASVPASSAAASASAMPSSSAPAGGASDKELCESVKKADSEMRPKLVKAMTSGEAAAYKDVLTELSQKLTAAVAGGGDGKVATVVEAFSAEASKAAAAADPLTAAENPAFEKAGASITAACKAAGVKVNF